MLYEPKTKDIIAYLWDLLSIELFVLMVLTFLLALKISGGRIW